MKTKLLLLGWLLLTSSAWAGIHERRIQFDPSLQIDILSGYPFDFNHLDKPLTIGLVFHNRSIPHHLRITLSGSVHTEQEIVLPPGEQRRLFLYLPHTWKIHAYQLRFTDLLSGRKKGPYPLQRNSSFYSTPEKPEYQLAQIGALGVPFNATDPWKNFGLIDPDHLPDRWQGLAGFSAIVMEARQLTQTKPWHAPLLDWVTMGGLLLVIPQENAEISPSQLWQGKPPFVRKRELADSWQVGLGQLTMIPPAELASVDEPFLARYGKILLHPRLFRSDHAITLQLRNWLPGIGEIPGWQLSLLLGGFALLVGPLGWWALVKRKGRPFLYLAMVMVSSLLFSGGMLAVNFATEGVTPLGTMRSLRLLDQRSDTDLRLEEAVVYAPTLLGTSLQASLGAVLVIPLENTQLYSGFRLHTGATQQTLEGGVPVRQVGLVGRLSLSTLQGRLVIEQRGETLYVENHLGQAIQSLEVMHEGLRYHLDALAAGQAANALPSAKIKKIKFPKGVLVQHGRTIVEGLRQKAFGPRYFIGLIAPVEGKQALLQQGLREMDVGPHHLLAGRY